MGQFPVKREITKVAKKPVKGQSGLLVKAAMGTIGASVGLAWDGVYKALTRNWGARSGVNRRAYDKLFREVAANCHVEDGHVYIGAVKVAKSDFEYFVHPVSGILLKVSGRAQAVLEKPVDLLKGKIVIKLDHNQYAVRESIARKWYVYSATKRPAAQTMIEVGTGRSVQVRPAVSEILCYVSTMDLRSAGFNPETHYFFSRHPITRPDLLARVVK